MQSDYAIESLLRYAFVNITKSVSVIHSNSCLSIHIPSERHFQLNKKDESIVTNQITQLYTYSLTTFNIDSPSNNLTLVPSFRSTPKPLSTGGIIGDYL